MPKMMPLPAGERAFIKALPGKSYGLFNAAHRRALAKDCSAGIPPFFSYNDTEAMRRERIYNLWRETHDPELIA